MGGLETFIQKNKSPCYHSLHEDKYTTNRTRKEAELLISASAAPKLPLKKPTFYWAPLLFAIKNAPAHFMRPQSSISPAKVAFSPVSLLVHSKVNTLQRKTWWWFFCCHCLNSLFLEVLQPEHYPGEGLYSLLEGLSPSSKLLLS